MQQIDQEKQAALDNICYVTLLTNLCEAMNAVCPISEAFSHLPKLIQMVLYINKKHLQTEHNASELFGMLSNEIIHYCQNRIDVREALNTKPTVGIKRANEAIDFCLYYKVIFEKIIEHANLALPLCENAIFNYLNLFMRRLHDLIEICQGIIIFERLEEKDDIELDELEDMTCDNEMRFGGIRGAEFELCCANIKANFTAGLQRIREAETNLLDIHNSENGWTEMIADYHRMVVTLEETIENLIKNVFMEVGNVEEGVEALGALYYYSLRPKIRAPYLRRTAQVWHMFDEEIHVTNRLLLDQLHCRNAQIGKYAGRASDLVSNRDRIARLRRIFEGAEWMPDYAYASKVGFIIIYQQQS